MTDKQEFPIVAVETDSPEDAGFTIQFDRAYNILQERLPVGEDAAIRAIEEAYGWGYTPEEMDERQQVGVLVTDADGNFLSAKCTM